MDWSATLSLTTSKARQHRANYGSFSSSSASLSRHGSCTTISIPESIPEHQCVDKFSSPRLKHAELQILDHVESECTSSNGSRWFSASSTTVTLTETSSTKTSSLNTFRMLLTSAHSVSASTPSTIDHRINESPSSEDHASSYWLQERERMMLERKQRYLRQNGSPTKAASLRSETGSSGYRTAMIMCSVPLVLVLVFVVIVLLFGDDAGAAASRRFLRASVESPQLEDTTS